MGYRRLGHATCSNVIIASLKNLMCGWQRATGRIVQQERFPGRVYYMWDFILFARTVAFKVSTASLLRKATPRTPCQYPVPAGPKSSNG
jgi:hypothetical protein